MVDAANIGKVSEPFVNDVEVGAVKKFALAIGDFNPLYPNSKYAAETVHKGIVAPPTFTVSFEQNLIPGVPRFKGGILREQELQLFRPIKVGERISCQVRLADVYEKPSRRFGKTKIVVRIHRTG